MLSREESTKWDEKKNNAAKFSRTAKQRVGAQLGVLVERTKHREKKKLRNTFQQWATSTNVAFEKSLSLSRSQSPQKNGKEGQKADDSPNPSAKETAEQPRGLAAMLTTAASKNNDQHINLESTQGSTALASTVHCVVKPKSDDEIVAKSVDEYRILMGRHLQAQREAEDEERESDKRRSAAAKRHGVLEIEKHLPRNRSLRDKKKEKALQQEQQQQSQRSQKMCIKPFVKFTDHGPTVKPQPTKQEIKVSAKAQAEAALKEKQALKFAADRKAIWGGHRSPPPARWVPRDREGPNETGPAPSRWREKLQSNDMERKGAENGGAEDMIGVDDLPLFGMKRVDVAGGGGIEDRQHGDTTLPSSSAQGGLRPPVAPRLMDKRTATNMASTKYCDDVQKREAADRTLHATKHIIEEAVVDEPDHVQWEHWRPSSVPPQQLHGDLGDSPPRQHDSHGSPLRGDGFERGGKARQQKFNFNATSNQQRFCKFEFEHFRLMREATSAKKTDSGTVENSQAKATGGHLGLRLLQGLAGELVGDDKPKEAVTTTANASGKLGDDEQWNSRAKCVPQFDRDGIGKSDRTHYTRPGSAGLYTRTSGASPSDDTYCNRPRFSNELYLRHNALKRRQKVWDRLWSGPRYVSGNSYSHGGRSPSPSPSANLHLSPSSSTSTSDDVPDDIEATDGNAKPSYFKSSLKESLTASLRL